MSYQSQLDEKNTATGSVNMLFNHWQNSSVFLFYTKCCTIFVGKYILTQFEIGSEIPVLQIVASWPAKYIIAVVCDRLQTWTRRGNKDIGWSQRPWKYRHKVKADSNVFKSLTSVQLLVFKGMQPWEQVKNSYRADKKNDQANTHYM